MNPKGPRSRQHAGHHLHRHLRSSIPVHNQTHRGNCSVSTRLVYTCDREAILLPSTAKIKGEGQRKLLPFHIQQVKQVWATLPLKYYLSIHFNFFTGFDLKIIKSQTIRTFKNRYSYHSHLNSFYNSFIKNLFIGFNISQK